MLLCNQHYSMGPETWEVGKLTPVNLRGYKSKFETNYQLRANFLRLSLWKNKKFVRKYFFKFTFISNIY